MAVTANFENYKNIRVFRYYFEDGKVRMQYKYNLQDKSTYLQDEWGPWEEKIVDYNDPDSGVTAPQQDSPQIKERYCRRSSRPRGTAPVAPPSTWHAGRAAESMLCNP